MRSGSWVLAALVGASALLAGDYDAIMGAVKRAWPERTQVAVLCDAGGGKTALADLASACSGMKITVLDIKGPQDVGRSIGALTGKKPDVVVLLAGDRNVGDGSPGATFLIQRLVGLKIPVVGTTEAAVKQGAMLAAGSGTGGKVLVNPKTAALMGLAAPEGTTPLQ